MNVSTKYTFTGTHYLRVFALSLLLSSMLHGCASIGFDSSGSEQASSAETSTEQTQDTANNTKSTELTQAEDQVKALEQQLESLKVEWEQQKPALERLVSNEADLEFLVQALADMSQLADEPSRDQYLGQDEMTQEKRQQSLVALQSLVTTQEELNTLLVELSSVVADVAANSQTIGTQQTASTAFSEPQQAQSSVASVVDVSTNDAQQPSASNAALGIQSSQSYSYSETTSSVQTSADCNCSNSDSSSPERSDPAKSRDPSWYAMTTPYAEATPAGSSNQMSQLDSGAASGQPIPGLQVKTFKRRSLPSELAAVGAPVQQYALAPQFHMSRKSLSDYVSQLAFKLAGNQQLAGNRVGVASFVFFDEQLEQTSSVGNQLAEELSTVLPNYGAKVIEYKLTREITVSPTGDLSLSRNTRKLRDSQGMDYVLTGTMVPTRRGLQINSRVVSTRDNVVIASATTLIPAMVLQQL